MEIATARADVPEDKFYRSFTIPPMLPKKDLEKSLIAMITEYNAHSNIIFGKNSRYIPGWRLFFFIFFPIRLIVSPMKGAS
jgi:hypothetical protein